MCVYMYVCFAHTPPLLPLQDGPLYCVTTRCECGDCYVGRHDGTENFACNTVIWFYLKLTHPLRVLFKRYTYFKTHSYIRY